MDKSILVVDDDRQLRLALKHILAREGYSVSEASNGYGALQSLAAAGGHFDAVLMDIIMPDKEGIETILEIRRKNPDLKIIAMSGGGRMHDYNPLKLARECGADFTIAKPFEPAEIRRLIRSCWT
jgi:two-component system chemotaxis response regulator CheY